MTAIRLAAIFIPFWSGSSAITRPDVEIRAIRHRLPPGQPGRDRIELLVAERAGVAQLDCLPKQLPPAIPLGTPEVAGWLAPSKKHHPMGERSSDCHLRHPFPLSYPAEQGP